MPLPSSGPIDLAQVQAEFGGVNPIGFDEYYQGAGTGFVTSSNYTPAGQIPTSGPISLANFYGVSKINFSIVGPASVNEGASATFNVTAAVPNGTTMFYAVLLGTTTTADYVGPAATGSFVVNSGIASFSIPISADATTEGPETFSVRISTSGIGGPYQATSNVATINDTSVTPGSFTFNDTVSSNLLGGYNLRTRAINAGWNGTSALVATITVDAGVYIIGVAGVPAFSTGTPALPGGSTITLTNNGIIGGIGGTGGTGGNSINNTVSNGSVGDTGGNGFFTNYAINVYNNGTIAGGGGGGGGGGAAYLDGGIDSKTGLPDPSYAASGGGGGGGRANGPSGANGTATASAPDSSAYGPDSGPTSGTLFAAGGGSSSGNVGSFGPDNGPGGAGGAFGQPGFPGGNPGGQFTISSGPGAGGAAGAAIQGGANISWYVYGTRLGSIDHPGINMLPGGVSGPLNIFAESQFVSQQNNGSVYAFVDFQGDGNIVKVEATTFQAATPQDAGDWYAPNTPGIGGGYWARLTRTSGTSFGYTGTAMNTWVQMNNISMQHSVLTNGYQDSTATYSVEISNNSSGSPILVTHTVSFIVVHEI